MNILSSLVKAQKILNKFNIKSYKLDSEVLLAEIINKSRKYIILNSKKNLSKKDLINFNSLIERRVKGEPVAYLLNKKLFCI